GGWGAARGVSSGPWEGFKAPPVISSAPPDRAPAINIGIQGGLVTALAPNRMRGQQEGAEGLRGAGQGAPADAAGVRGRAAPGGLPGGGEQRAAEEAVPGTHRAGREASPEYLVWREYLRAN